MAPNTVASYLQALSAMFNWAKHDEWLDKNPAEGLGERGKPNVKRRGFEAEELKTIFTPLRQEKRPSRFWIPALGLYSGARLNELCQLAASDVGEADGIPFMDFSEFDAETGERLPDRSLKTDASDRRVPIHAELVDAGFLTFVQGVRESGGGRLFPDQPLGPDGKHSHSFSKWFAAHLDRIGLTQKSLVFHSFRHGIRDACREAEIAEEIADALGGWTTAGVGRKYGDRSRLRFLARASAKVHFPGFRLADFLQPGGR
jgi:integrase